MKKLSEIANRLDGQPMFKLLKTIRELEEGGRDILHFEIGDPDYSTPKKIVQAACDSLLNGETNYVESSGLLEFREEVCNATHRSRGFQPNVSQVLITPGANIAIYYAIQCLVDPGCEVIVPDPGFPTYYSTIKMCGAVAVRIPLRESNAFHMDPEDIRKGITDKTRLIIINSPQNPTGAVMTQDEMKKIYDIAEEYDLYIYSDEIYARMIYGDTSFSTPSIYDKCKKRVIISNGFSKAFAMTGWRLGAVIGPDEVIERMGLLLQTTSSCVAPFIQKAGIEAIRGDQSVVVEMMAEYEARRNLLVEGLNSIRGISCNIPDGAFYVMANIESTGMTSEEFATYLLYKADVAVLPGDNFGEHGEGYVRLCYATSQEKIILAISRIKTLMESDQNLQKLLGVGV